MKRLVVRTLLAVACLVGLGVAVVWYALKPPAPLPVESAAFSLQDMVVVNPASGRTEHRSLTVLDGRIRLAAAESAKVNDLAQRYRGRYVLPGLVDMHAHLPPGNPLKLSSYFLLLYLAHGVTSIRDAGDVDGTSLAAQREAVSAEYPGPRVFACGPFVSAGKRRWANTVLLRGPEDADPVAAKLKAEGSHCIKAYDGLTLPMLQALHRAADKHGLKLIGHVPETLSYEQALIPDVQHLMGVTTSVTQQAGQHRYLSDGWQDVDDARLRAIVAVTKRYGIANTPTLVLGQQLLRLENYAQSKDDPDMRLLPRLYRDVVWNPSIGIPTYRNMSAADFEQLRIAQAKKQKLVRLLYDAGTQLYLGTDVQQPFVNPGISLQQEMRLFEQAGIPSEKIWDLATRQAGASLGLPQLGTITDGAPADFLIFREDPTRDLRALGSLEAVVSQGHLYTKQSIDAKLAEYQAHYQSFIFDRLSVLLAKAALRKTTAVDSHE